MRQQQIAAAEKRMQEQQQRGIGNIQVVERQRQLDQDRERRENEIGHMANKPGMKVRIYDNLIQNVFISLILFISVASQLKGTKTIKRMNLNQKIQMPNIFYLNIFLLNVNQYKLALHILCDSFKKYLKK